MALLSGWVVVWLRNRPLAHRPGHPALYCRLTRRRSVPLKDPVAAIVSILRRVHGDDAARAMLAEGMTLATLLNAAFSLPMANREGVRMIVRAVASGDFIISPGFGSLWHLRHIYEDRRASLRVVDMEVVTPDGAIASGDIWLRLPPV
jgi:hypothetical protein